MEPPATIDAGAVVLRRWEPEWAEVAAAAVQASLAELAPFMPWATGDYNADTARAFAAASAEQWRKGEAFEYAVFTPEGELVGSCGLMTRMGPGTLEIGYWIHSAHTRRGYASQAAAALARVGLSLPGIERVVIRHDAANVGSAAVAAKAGFTQVDRQPHDRSAPGESGVDVIWERR
ncbi:MAG: GNAT family N-acetyltransferase [Micromonosporaceae bacterium]|nr:GNAT family N-acetyltransferase [Micromonosporaceae bacterium]